MGTSNRKAMYRALRGLPSKLSRIIKGAATGRYDKDLVTRHGRRTLMSEVGPETSSNDASTLRRGPRARPDSKRTSRIRENAQKKSQPGHDSIPFLDRETHLPVETRVAGQLSNTAETMKAMAEVTRELSGVDPGPQAPQPIETETRIEPQADIQSHKKAESTKRTLSIKAAKRKSGTKKSAKAKVKTKKSLKSKAPTKRPRASAKKPKNLTKKRSK